MSPHRLSLDEARRIAVRAQLLDAQRAGDVVEVADQIRYLKIDPTAVIAPCEHTVAWSRIGYPYEPGQLSKAVETDRLLFEFEGAFWSADLLPLLRPILRTRPRRDSTRQWLAANERFRADVVARVRAEGPIVGSDIPDTAQVARASDGWYGPNQVPIMLEALAEQGVLAVAGRRGRTKLWDLAERVWPADVPELAADEAEQRMRERRLRAAGVARNSQWCRIKDAGEPAEIDGLAGRWRVDPEALRALEEEPFQGRVAFLNPYDPMLFDRPRLNELFGFPFVLEQFKPKDQRKYGFFAHPVLVDERFVAMLDASLTKDGTRLEVRAVHELEPLEDAARTRIDDEVRDLADWLGAEPVLPGAEPDD